MAGTLQLNTATLMVEENGTPLYHMLDKPEVYKSLTFAEIPPKVREEIGTDQERVNIVYYSDKVQCEMCMGIDRVAYLIPSLPDWSITLCRKDGLLWGNLETPLFH